MKNLKFNIIEQWQLVRDEARTGLGKSLWTGFDYEQNARRIDKNDVKEFVRGVLANNCIDNSYGRPNLSTRMVPSLEEQISKEKGRDVAILFAGMANVYRNSGDTENEQMVFVSLKKLMKIRFCGGHTFESKEIRQQNAQDAIIQLNAFFGEGENRSLPTDEDQRMKDIVAYHFMKNA